MARSVGYVTPVWAFGGAERWWLTLRKYAKRWSFDNVYVAGKILAPAQGVNLLTNVEPSDDLVLCWASEGASFERGVFVIHGATSWPKMCRRQHANKPAVAVSDFARWAVDPLAAVIPNGVDFDRLSGRKNLRPAWGVSEKEILVLYVGRYSEEKRPCLAATAARGLRERGYHARSVYCCPNTDKAEVSLIDSGAIFVDDKDLGSVYRSCDVLITGAVEGFGLTIAEAWHCEIPVVATPTGVCREPGCEKWFVELDNPVESVLEAIDRGPTANPHRFSAERSVQQWEDYLDAVYDWYSSSGARRPIGESYTPPPPPKRRRCKISGG